MIRDKCYKFSFLFCFLLQIFMNRCEPQRDFQNASYKTYNELQRHHDLS